MQMIPQLGGALSRGVEGEKETGESSPIPKWVTKSALKEKTSEGQSKEYNGITPCLMAYQAMSTRSKQGAPSPEGKHG